MRICAIFSDVEHLGAHTETTASALHESVDANPGRGGDSAAQAGTFRGSALDAWNADFRERSRLDALAAPGANHDAQDELDEMRASDPVYEFPAVEDMPKPDMVGVTKYVTPNWLTPANRDLVVAAIKEKMPDLKDARFFTLTIDPRRVGALLDEQTGETVITDGVCVAGYEAGKAQLTAFFRRIRFGFAYRIDDEGEVIPCHPFEPGAKTWSGIGKLVKYCWKLEVQSNGMPHWHSCFLHNRPIPIEAIRAAWELGAIDVERIKGNSMDYLLKYVSKSPFQDETGGLPDWMLDYPKQIRFWQTSKGFYATSKSMGEAGENDDDSEEEVEEKEPKKRAFKTIREKLALYPRLVRIWDAAEQFPILAQLREGLNFGHVLVAAAFMAIGLAGPAPSNSFRCELPAFWAADMLA